MTSLLNSLCARLRILPWWSVPAALGIAIVGLMIAIGMLYKMQSDQRALLALNTRTSGWVAYQAQLEFVKTEAALRSAAENPSAALLDNLGLRLEVLYSRLPILYSSDEGKLLRDIDDFEPTVKAYQGEIGGYIDALPGLAAGSPAAAATLAAWIKEIEPLGRDLQRILQTSVAYNEDVFRRERELAGNPAVVPLVLLFVFGVLLVFLLGIQAARDRRRLADILDAKAAEAATEASLQAMVEEIPSAILIIDPADETISFLNPAAAALVDSSPSNPEWRELLRAAAAAFGHHDSRAQANITFSRLNGGIVSLRGAQRQITWKGRPHLLLTLSDTSQLRDAELQVMQAAKLATLGEMATAIAHELNQPLAVIKMATSNAKRLVASGGGLDAIAAKLDRIVDQVDRAKRITDQVRRYGRLPAQQTGTFSLRRAIELASGFVAEQYRSAGIRLDIDLDLPDDLPVAGEQTMFEQVIVNLLVNARDAFAGKDVKEQFPRVSIQAWLSGDEAIIDVNDTAGGIREDIIERLFEPFATTKPADVGTGLGLSMSRSIIRDMNGTIVAKNANGGACFSIRLPLAPASARSKDAA